MSAGAGSRDLDRGSAPGERTQQAPCAGVVPLTPRLEVWQRRVIAAPQRIRSLLTTYGSPLHLHNLRPFRRNLRELLEVAEQAKLDFDLYFARKANKCLSYVSAAVAAGAGIDIASEEELRQSLDLGVEAEKVMVTAAIKPPSFLELCSARGILLALDNQDEARQLAAIARRGGQRPPVALRISGFTSGGQHLESRFGFPIQEVPELLAAWRAEELTECFELRGLHFHLDGYSAKHRIDALDQCLALADDLEASRHPIDLIDMGGGFPMSYLVEAGQWESFWRRLKQALRGEVEPITYRGHGFGLRVHGNEVLGRRRAYPHHQHPVRADWLRGILFAARPSKPAESIASGLRKRRIRLACEPGRSLLDGCGATVARVVHRKPWGEEWLIGLEMNSSNCRSKKSEIFTDPILVRLREHATPEPPTAPVEGYLTGAYCTESGLISHRKLCFAAGVEVGDCFLFANTAGYLMHFTESRSHQFPLPLNVVLEGEDLTPRLDAIDQGR